MVVTHLRLALPWDDFALVMGPALLSREDETLRFDLTKFPEDWTRYGPDRNNKKWESRPSKRRDAPYRVSLRSVAKR